MKLDTGSALDLFGLTLHVTHCSVKSVLIAELIQHFFLTQASVIVAVYL